MKAILKTLFVLFLCATAGQAVAASHPYARYPDSRYPHGGWTVKYDFNNAYFKGTFWARDDNMDGRFSPDEILERDNSFETYIWFHGAKGVDLIDGVISANKPFSFEPYHWRTNSWSPNSDNSLRFTITGIREEYYTIFQGQYYDWYQSYGFLLNYPYLQEDFQASPVVLVRDKQRRYYYGSEIFDGVYNNDRVTYYVTTPLPPAAALLAGGLAALFALSRRAARRRPVV